MVGTNKHYEVAVIGAGVFGAWIAYQLQRAGQSVVLLDAHGAANSRASSGGESRIIRMGYGADDIYTRWAMRSLSLWQDFCRQVGEPLFHRTGVLWMAREDDPYSVNSLRTLQQLGVRCEQLSRADLEKRYPQIAFGSVSWGLFEPDSGALMARRAVHRVVQEALKSGADYLPEAIDPLITQMANGPLRSLTTRSGLTVRAGTFVFACGPWLPRLFPDLLQGRISPTRQEVFFFGVDPGDRRFAPPLMPAWIDFSDQIYGIPDLETRGFKIAPDRHGPPFDPETGDRVVTSAGLGAIRTFLAQRFPGLKNAPLLETRVCQYENTSSGDFLIDRHPACGNVWLVGGGSGHGFKHGPALGDYVANRVMNGGSVEPRFTLAAKGEVQKRAVF
jgi:glycine/D-amino acid oxidase-like deaminating enzyme